MTAPVSSSLLVTAHGYGVLGRRGQVSPLAGVSLCMVVHDPTTGHACPQRGVYLADVEDTPTLLCPGHTATLRALRVIGRAETNR